MDRKLMISSGKKELVTDEEGEAVKKWSIESGKAGLKWDKTDESSDKQWSGDYYVDTKERIVSCLLECSAVVDGRSDESEDQQNEVPDPDSNEEEKIRDVCGTDGKENECAYEGNTGKQ
ncbi:hypothetical protein E2C01_063074 [Portunus trituberculatus]|uniref:Uncharacterized protein n=1 Tax=Portunus trituberculatus TaxID=210409 RepID=A0A5B7HJU6_PORTR|nr:hypothetical protein [Portunus trituberculatus]